ncbi:MAG: SOS response-associated peptidase [Planctomycetaceae bacterium]
MCGRFTLRLTPAELADVFRLLREPEWTPRFNIAPTQSVAVLRPEGTGFGFSLMRWGLIPSWAKDLKIGPRLINARAETVAEKPAFRSAFKRRRCLIPADGFYEWKAGDGKTKQPYLIGLRGDSPFAFAGLWERWTPPDGVPVESCTIITTEPNELCREVHDRMPAILHVDDYDRWLDPRAHDADALRSLLVSYPAAEMRMHPVGRLVNNARNEDPACVDRVDAPNSPDGQS